MRWRVAGRVGVRGQCVAIQSTQFPTHPTLLYVDSQRQYCPHNPFIGSTTRSLRKDCSWCTTAVCNISGYQSCCSPTGIWNEACRQKALAVCGGLPPPGGGGGGGLGP